MGLDLGLGLRLSLALGPLIRAGGDIAASRLDGVARFFDSWRCLPGGRRRPGRTARFRRRPLGLRRLRSTRARHSRRPAASG
ncbi:hypothetical protein DMA15_27970 [Streptomyces sp. WAC 01529]|nr:hypothetical protein DMA15_27970 [Streptomyces sp. WAC 01529]